MRRPALRLCLAFLMAASACDCGGEEDDVDAGEQTDDGGALLPFGFACTANAECASGLCLGSGICSAACQGASDCPAFEPWACTDVGGQPRCTCTVASSVDACNLVDDDCNGLVDDGPPCSDGLTCTDGICACPAERQCGATCADLQNDVNHCGACDNECEVGSSCVEGECACAGESCDGVCADLQSDARHCGACGNVCSSHQECVAGECQAADLEWARWPVLNSPLLVSDGENTRDQTTGLLWQKVAAWKTMTWDEARAHCGALNDPPRDGTGDNVAVPGRPWRLPTRIELLSIVDYRKSNPAVTAGAFEGDGPVDGPFWTATRDAADEGKAWVVNFNLGTPDTFRTGLDASNPDSTFIKQFARCVK